MPIKSGIGFGAAQVYNQPSALVNTYSKLLQQQAQENAKFQNELADLISKVKTEGARDIDKPLITKAYDEVKDLYRQAASIRNSSERNLIRSQLTSGIQSLNEAAARSAEEAKLYKETLGRVATTGQFLYDPKKLNEFKQRISKPITELTEFNPLDLERIPDDSIRDKAFDNIYNELKNKSVYKTVNIGGGKEQEVGVVNPTVVTANIIERIGKSPDWLNLATRNYVQANPDKEPKIEDIIDNEVKLYMVRRGNEYAGTPTRIPRATGGSGSGADNEKLTYRQQLITGLVNKDNTAKEDLKANLPANSKVEYLTSKAIPGKSKGGYGLIRITIPEASSPTGVEIVEDISLQSGSVAQKLNYIINQYGSETISPSKVGISGGRPRGEKFKVTQQPAAKKEIKQSEIKAKALAAGYSVAEYTKLLQKNGIKIIK
jgi:hypothetical protein